MNILIIEDDTFLANSLRRAFEKTVMLNRLQIVHSYVEFLKEMVYLSSYDIILSDICIEKDGYHGLEIIKKVREKNKQIPIVMISGLSEVDWIEKSFQNGANDYIIKPFRMKELEVRIGKWFKDYCYTTFLGGSDTIDYKDLSYHFATNSFSFSGIKLELSKKIKYILFILLLHSQKLVTESYLKEKVWGDRDLFRDRNMRVYILRLKKSLEPFGLSKHIKSIRGEGYMLK